MELINSILNLIAPIFTFFFFISFLPPYYLYKTVQSFFTSVFCEDVAGKVVLITGASSGIGEHLAYSYAKRGAQLALVGRRMEALDEVSLRAQQWGCPDVITIQADVSKPDDCKKIIEETIRNFGRLDHLVNNAGVVSVYMFEDASNLDESARAIMDTNFWGSVYTTRFALPHLKQSKGRIVVMSSVDAWLPLPRQSFYNASKAAMMLFFETLRVEVGSEVGITIVTPGVIEAETTKGKCVKEDGSIEVDQDMRDVQYGLVPVRSVSACAEAIVKSATRGDNYLTDPKWFKVAYYFKAFCPDLVELFFRWFATTSRGTHPHEALNKKILDYTGANKIFYPSTILSPEVKTD